MDRERLSAFYEGDKSEKLEDYPRISELEECIKETVVGQDELVKSIATSIYNSIFMGIRCVELIIGGTGTGKTITMECFCKEFGMAYTIENATQYTQEGYKGDSVNQMLTNLLHNAELDFEKAQNGMLIIDEIGKKTSKGRGNNDGRDISGEGVIDSLLPILSGATVNIEVNNRTLPFDTSNLKIFLMDACSGIDEIKKERVGDKSLGFIKSVSASPILSSEGNVYTKEDLIEYGFTPELVGRINGIHVTNPMSEDILIRILKESKNSVLLQYMNGLEKMGIKIEPYPDFYKEVAKKAMRYETGARELENIVKFAFRSLMYDIYDSKRKVKEVKIKEGITEDNTKYELIYE